ncbi:MAG: alkaline phosphatase family protein, partial [Planctomycetes bacterium]|nr:alkaline phosphatase family protein [Planctomycetota bacterium]
LGGLDWHAAQSIFPAVTCSVQAAMRTASPAAKHGMISNGLHFRALHRPAFWEQSADLVAGRRIWDRFRAAGRTVGLMFWQQSLGERADLVLSPAPIHKHSGGMVQDCYSQPADLYARLRSKIGRPFNLMRYWGPLASPSVGDWIAEAVVAVLRDDHTAPDLLLAYLPTLDYDLQRYPHDHARVAKALTAAIGQIERIIHAARDQGYHVLVYGDYAITPTAPGDAAVFPNRELARAGLFTTRRVAGRTYGDFHTARAWAMVDHELAHVYVRDAHDLPAVGEVLHALPGVAEILDRSAQAALHCDHPNAGELLILAEPGRWLAYPWWSGAREAPDYARHIDIHNKPGFDPCELLFGWPPWTVTQNTARIRGTHGRAGSDRKVAWATTLALSAAPTSLLELAAAVAQWLDSQ